MLKKTFVALAAVGVASAISVGSAQARDQVQVAGSSTVLPFSTVVAEQFGKSTQFDGPVVASGGSSGGLKKFCEGVGPSYIDVANASRAIKSSEVEACAAAGVVDIREVKFGYDGIVFANAVGQPNFAFKPEYVYLALAATVPENGMKGGELVANPFTNWSQIDPSLPDLEITAYIPGEKHGTREVFEEKVLEVGCEKFDSVMAVADKDERENICMRVRKDGKAVDIDGDYTETLARMEATPYSIGVFGLSFYDQNRDKVKVATMNGVTPSIETIASGEYPVSRPLYFYVKGAHLPAIPGLNEYVQFFLSEDMIGDDGMLIDKGLIPAPESQREEFRADWASGKQVAKN